LTASNMASKDARLTGAGGVRDRVMYGSSTGNAG
jgi:hypothetical protein